MSSSSSKIKNSLKSGAPYLPILFVVLSFIAMTLLSYFFVHDIVDEHLHEEARTTLSHMGYELISELRNMEAVLDNVSIAIENMLHIGEDADKITSFIKYYTDNLHINEVRYPGVITVFAMFDLFGGMRYNGIGSPAPEGSVSETHLWFTAAEAANGTIIMTEPHVDSHTNEVSITFARCLYGENNDKIATVGLDIDLYILWENVISRSSHKKNYTVLIDANQIIIAHPNTNIIGLPLREADIGLSALSDDMEKGLDILDRNILNYQEVASVAYAERLSNDWYICVITPVSDYFASTDNMRIFLILLGISFAAVLSIILYFTIKRRVTADRRISESTHALDMLNSVLSKSDAMIYVSDIETDRILFINDTVKQHFKVDFDVVGRHCYEIFHTGKTARCEHCPCFKLDRNPDTTIVWEEFNEKTSRFYQNTDKYIDWTDGKKAHIHFRTDITDVKTAQEKLKQQTIEILEGEERAKIMLDATPLGANLWDKDYKLIDCNEVSPKIFGLNSKEEYKERFFELNPEFQPCGRKTSELIVKYLDKALAEGLYVYEWMMQLLDGTPVPIEVTCVRVPYKNDFIVTSYIRDMREHKKMMSEINHTQELLQTVNLAAETLLTVENDKNIEAVLLASMELIGLSIEVDRVQIWRNELIDGELNFVNTYEWLSETGKQKSLAGVGFKIPYSIKPKWKSMFMSGEYICKPFSKMSPEDQAFFKTYEVKTAVIMPLFLKEQFWGFFSIDDCVKERDFTQNEVNILRSVSIMMANTINRSAEAAKLKEAHNRVKVIMQASPIGTTLWDKNCRLFDCNEAYVRLFNLNNIDEFLERHYELSPERQPDGQPSGEKISNMVKKAFDEGKVEFDWMHKTFDGLPIPCSVTMVRVAYEGDYAVAGYLTDLREHHEMMSTIERRDKLLSVANRVAGTLLQSDSSNYDEGLMLCLGMIAQSVEADRASIWKNNIKEDRLYCTQVYEWLGNAESQIGKRSVTIEMSYDDVIPGWEKILSDGRYINSLVSDMSPAEQKQLSVQGIKSLCVTPIFVHGNFWGFMGLDHCREERLLDESELDILLSCGLMIANSLLRNEMLQNIRHTSIRLESALEVAKAASRAKSDFLSSMSHEMRTPMNAIIGMAVIGKSAKDMEQKDNALDKIEDASSHLLGVINDVLDMAKIEADKLDLAPIEYNFEKMLQKIMTVIRFKADEKQQIISINSDGNIPRFVVGDQQRLTQIIINLLSNAVKFTPEGGKISLSAFLAKEIDGNCELKIEVTDSGIGISGEHKERLFNAFEQADIGTSRKFGGTGLGLAISKRIIELMGGRIWVESSLGKGAKFNFTVKVQRGKKSPLSLLSSGVNWKNVRILVVDDLKETREQFQRLLDSLEIACDVASDGNEACKIIKERGVYDIYFIDWRMPVMDGIELTKWVKSYSDERRSVVTMITAQDWDAIKDEAFKAGVDKYLLKPLVSSMIIDSINECLGMDNSKEEDASQKSGEFSGKTILLVEDIEINREILIMLLEDSGLNIETAENGKEALELIQAAPERYDLIFMDLQMPVMDGLEATRKIRAYFKKTRRSKDIMPIIAMTANVFKSDIEECMAAGMDAHLGKPIDVDAVYEVLRKYLKRGRK